MPTSLKERAESLELLTPRLKINERCQSKDFQTWLQSKLQVVSGEHVLDLACGDGAQATYFDKAIDQHGYLRCVDIHEPSIRKLIKDISKSDAREFFVSDMMDFKKYLDGSDSFTLAHCSFALPYASDPELVIRKLSHSLQRPFGRLAISLPCRPHGMVDFIKTIHSIPESVELAIDLGENLCVSVFRDCFEEVEVNYFKSKLNFDNKEDFMELYSNTTYYSENHRELVADSIDSVISKDGVASFDKNAILIRGKTTCADS